MASTASSNVAPPRGSETLTMEITPQFKLVFLSVVGITLLSVILTCAVWAAGVQMRGASWSPDTDPLFQALLTTWKLGFGAIIGLIGGKAV